MRNRFHPFLPPLDRGSLSAPVEASSQQEVEDLFPQEIIIVSTSTSPTWYQVRLYCNKYVRTLLKIFPRAKNK